MLHELFLVLALLLCFCGLVLALNRRRGDDLPPYGPLGGLLALAVVAYLLTPATPRAMLELYHPPVVGGDAALRLGLWAQTQLDPPRPAWPAIVWLARTLQGRSVVARPIIPFRQPGAAGFRRAGIRRYFADRFGWADALITPFEPRALIVHSTEGESEAHAYEIFERNTRAQYLGGVWTHFSVGPDGRIYQYGPLNRISKGQAGLDDSSVGIEIVGTASLWEGPTQTRTGSIIRRWRKQDRAQLLAVADLLRTLRRHYAIPADHVFSHEELGHIRDLKGNHPDFQWLRQHIRDRVYLGLEPTLDKNFRPEQLFSFLEPYDRQDPGRDVVEEIRRLMDKG
ncbi:MAG: N-acetylmuramoyl-L-alanine amidase [Candidatus Sericytochromatia bacterium]